MAALVAIPLVLVGCRDINDQWILDRAWYPATVNRALERDPKSYLVLDVRPKPEFETGRLPGAEMMNANQVDIRDPEPRLRQYKDIIVYGRDAGHAQAMALAKKLAQADVGDVRLMYGGFADWKAQGFPVVTNAPAPAPPDSGKTGPKPGN
ncbi:MAG: rhodanese-like domain-containing protein [Phycisphaerales bacterium]|nr:rhodanese-like domain-containing protein [Phycisphaerales bacterium]